VYNLDLFDLIKIVTELAWIPSKVPLDKTARESGISPDDALSKGDVGYFADVTREIRDMVHPGRHARLWKDVRISKRHYQFCYEIAEVVFEHLYAKLEDSIRREMDL